MFEKKNQQKDLEKLKLEMNNLNYYLVNQNNYNYMFNPILLLDKN